MSSNVAVPLKVRWGPSDGQPAGIRVWAEEGMDETFIPWSDLQPELQKQLLPQAFADPSGFKFETREHHGKPQWLVQVFDDQDELYCDVWFGNDPDNGWSFDGLVRVGDPATAPHAWQVYQRYSDGTYRRLPSLSPTIDRFKR